jgi:Tetratricopeptide repeat/Glycosyltransferase family 9 (heptosyltransferase)
VGNSYLDTEPKLTHHRTVKELDIKTLKMPPPSNPQPLLQSASALAQAGKFPQAESLCRQILSQNPNHPDALHLLGIVLGRLGKTSESIATLRQALQLQPNSAQLHHNLGFALRLAGAHPAESIPHFQRAIQLNPNIPDAHNNLGISHKELLQLDAAEKCFEKAIQLKPDFIDAHWNLSLVLLTRGDFPRGMREYLWRKKRVLNPPLPVIPQPPWTGDDPRDKTILLYPEQGMGDAIQFVRYVPHLAPRAAGIILGSAPELARLFQRSFPQTTVATVGSPNPPFNSNCSLLDLPLLFRTSLTTIPASIPYLIPDPTLVEKWARILGPRTSRLRVALTWAGNPNHPNDRLRSLDPALLAPLSQIPGVDFYSLQKNRATHPPNNLNLIDHTAQLNDFDETAALIQNLDLVIAVDTSIAHLAGALGKPTWLLLPHVPDWRWLLDRSDSPWYPTMRLFRQPALSQWPPVIDAVATALRQLPPAP